MTNLNLMISDPGSILWYVLIKVHALEIHLLSLSFLFLKMCKVNSHAFVNVLTKNYIIRAFLSAYILFTDFLAIRQWVNCTKYWLLHIRYWLFHVQSLPHMFLFMMGPTLWGPLYCFLSHFFRQKHLCIHQALVNSENAKWIWLFFV